MYFFIYSIVGAIIVFTGLTVGKMRSKGLRILISSITALFVGYLGWGFMPTFAWNFLGNWTLLGIVGLVVVISVALNGDGVPNIGACSPLLAAIFVTMLVGPITSSSIFHADSYHQLLGKPVESDFATDVSPIDIKQMRKVDQKLAALLGEKRLEAYPGLGSRVDLDKMNIQTVNGSFRIKDGNGKEQNIRLENRLVWVGPLVHSGVFKYLSNHTTPGYVMVTVDDPSNVWFVTALAKSNEPTGTSNVNRMGSVSTPSESDYEPIELRFLYTGGYFDGFVERHLRTNGYASAGLTDYSFEIDNSGRPYWVITKFKPTIGFGGDEAIGVVVVDAQTGANEEYSLADAPAWIDRIQPEAFITTQLKNWGGYVHGWWNTVFGKLDVVTTTPGMQLIYGADGQSYWYTGMQSSGSDQATNSFVLANTRTKEVRRYMISGANENAAKSQAEAHPEAKKGGLTATDPILYNVGGVPTYFVTLKGSSGVVQMYAFISVQNYETVGIGRDVQSALRDYQNALIQQGQGVQIDDLVAHNRFDAVVIAMVKDGEFFYLRLVGQENKEFYGTSSVSPELKWTKSGDNVTVEADEGTLNSIPMIRFENNNLSITVAK